MEIPFSTQPIDITEIGHEEEISVYNGASITIDASKFINRRVSRFRFVNVSIPRLSPFIDDLSISNLTTLNGTGVNNIATDDIPLGIKHYAEVAEIHPDLQWASQESMNNRYGINQVSQNISTDHQALRVNKYPNELWARVDSVPNGLVRAESLSFSRWLDWNTPVWPYERLGEKTEWWRYSTSGSPFTIASERNNFFYYTEIGNPDTRLYNFGTAYIQTTGINGAIAETPQELIELMVTALNLANPTANGIDIVIDENGFAVTETNKDGGAILGPPPEKTIPFGSPWWSIGMQPLYDGASAADTIHWKANARVADRWAETTRLYIISEVLSGLIRHKTSANVLPGVDGVKFSRSNADYARESNYSIGVLNQGDNGWIELREPTDLSLIDLTFTMVHQAINLKGRAITGLIQFE